MKDIAFFTTLAGYIHWKLSGEKVLGIGEAAGMFPIDSTIMDFDQKMLDQFDGLHNFDWKIRDILPKVLVAGEPAGVLTAEGAKLLDSTGTLQPGVPMCPPEGDAGTGMVATNSVAVRTGNVSAGTSIFAMVVLEKSYGKSTRRDRYGDHSRRYAGSYGTLQQLYLRSECLGKSSGRMCRELWRKSR